jgi:hypothetical protein
MQWLKNTFVFQDFLMAINPATFFIKILLPKAFPPQADICLDNDRTKERLLTKMEEAKVQEEEWEEVVLLISRYSLGSTKKWIEGKELYQKRIYLSEKLKFIEI